MRKAVLIFLLVFAPKLFSQSSEKRDVKIVNHQVMMGETVRMLSKKYLVSPADIYKMNKFAVDGISNGMVLQIPVPVKDEVVEKSTKHKVKSGETLPDVARQYGVQLRKSKTRILLSGTALFVQMNP